ncbi:zinc finger CCCH domain-containing protein 12 isoform X1 [Sesamum indicum]|uniref:Zinc finger CCCH domain-containing protein 12 isoform X1 n=1 Tax=Sesamum indicum TaxID=4182 RepID=A0A6I9U421_SESIN|nr:zinc finger CCCH domain-containing protein 12 isoform X1 [Sesamum indicum]XP_011092348.1 zinc finger CCCH domain-containing protein 12 isoform X1 [Sesamum indicum]
MDYRRENGFSSGNVVQVLSGNSGNAVNESWGAGYADQAVWATEDDYGMWNAEASFDNNSNSNYDGRVSQSRSGSEPPNKRSRNSQSGDLAASNRSKAIGKMFYKTKLCCKFRAGTCPYITNCNFAHSIEELRKPPPNWQEIVAAHEEERAVSSEPREEFQIPILGVSDDTQRSYKGRHCKKFYTDEGCPYGENCTFLHDEQSKARESVAISLGPGSGGGYGSNGSSSALKPSNWKTRICNKWELTGYCPFGSKCHFAHGAAAQYLPGKPELHRYGGGPMDSEVKDSSTPDAKQGVPPAKTSVDIIVASATSVPHSDGYHHIGVPSQRLSNVIQKTGQRSTQKWKGPDKISKIYGDWIDDLE